MEDKNIFSKVEEKTNVKKEDIIKLAKKASSQDLSDEKNIRKLIKEVAKLAGKDVSKEKEEKILNAIKKDKVPKDFKNVL
ncbi:MAG: stage VI sporulation protein F [Bacilli bacterium]|nr:stage VI sporulation protein F [Bacillales bacterium]MDY2575624.1 stage VI sporulation protein F [Bacilli bacterium]